MPTPPHIKEKIQEVTDVPQEAAVGGRIKRRRTRSDFSSEKNAELLSQLQTTHMTAALQTDQRTSRTVEEYADSGLHSIDINNNDHLAFPPVGFALPIFELVETPSAWRLPTFVPEGGRI